MTDLPVSQRAREAAASAVEWQQNATREWSEDAWQFFATGLPDAIRRGLWDNHDFVQAFARFEAAVLSGLAAAPSSDSPAAPSDDPFPCNCPDSGKDGHHPLCLKSAASHTAPTDTKAEAEVLREALSAAYSWLEYENSPMGPSEAKQYERLMSRIEAALNQGRQS